MSAWGRARCLETLARPRRRGVMSLYARHPSVTVAALAPALAVAGCGGSSAANSTGRARPTTETTATSPCAPGEEVRVLVAESLIPKGTPGSVIVRKHLAVWATVTCAHRVIGAISDKNALRDHVTVSDIFPGQQITQSDVSTH